MVIRDVCPRCKAPKYKKNGHIHNSKQNHHCHDCGRQFVQSCEQYLIAEDQRGLIERLLLIIQRNAVGHVQAIAFFHRLLLPTSPDF